MSTTKITSLPVLSSPTANAENTVFVVVDKSSGTATTKQLSLQNLDLFVDNVGSVAFAQANAAYAQANTANITAQAAFDQANTANVLAQASFNQANSVYLPSVTRLNVTNSGSSAFLLDQYSGNNPTIYINAGETISFNLNSLTQLLLILFS